MTVVRFVQIEEENHKHRFGKTYGSHKISSVQPDSFSTKYKNIPSFSTPRCLRFSSDHLLYKSLLLSLLVLIRLSRHFVLVLL